MAEKTAAKNPEASGSRGSSEGDAAVARISRSIDVARLQFKRLRKDIDDYNALLRQDASVRVFGDHPHDENLPKSREIRTSIFVDVQTLLTNLHETDKMLSKLKAQFPLDPDLSNLSNTHRPLLRYCEEFRMHMERFENKKGVEDFGELDGNVFTFQGRTLNLGPSFENTAEAFFSDVMAVWVMMSTRQRKIRDLISRRQGSE